MLVGGYERSSAASGLCTSCREGFRQSAVACVECESNATAVVCVFLMIVRRQSEPRRVKLAFVFAPAVTSDRDRGEACRVCHAG